MLFCIISRDLKEHLRRLQQQSDSRRRAAVMEMMRQRAAEVAGSNGWNLNCIASYLGRKLWKKAELLFLNLLPWRAFGRSGTRIQVKSAVCCQRCRKGWGGEGECSQCAHYSHILDCLDGLSPLHNSTEVLGPSDQTGAPHFQVSNHYLPYPELKIVDLSVSTSPGDCLIYLSLGAIHGWQVYYMRPNLSVFKENSGGCLFVLFFCLLSLSLIDIPCALWEGQPAIFSCWPFFPHFIFSLSFL